MIKDPAALGFIEQFGEEADGFLAGQEMVLIGGFLVAVAGRDHHPFDAEFGECIEKPAEPLGIDAVVKRGIGRNAKAFGQGGFDGPDDDIVNAITADGGIVLLFGAVEMDGKREIFRRRELVEMFFEQQRIGAEVNEFLAGHQTSGNLANLRMQQGFAAGNGDNRGAALLGRCEALLWRQLFPENVSGILNFPAASTGEVTAEQWFQHQNQRIAIPTAQPLRDDVFRNGPHL